MTKVGEITITSRGILTSMALAFALFVLRLFGVGSWWHVLSALSLPWIIIFIIGLMHATKMMKIEVKR